MPEKGPAISDRAVFNLTKKPCRPKTTIKGGAWVIAYEAGLCFKSRFRGNEGATLPKPCLSADGLAPPL